MATQEDVLAATQRWLERAVIGLNLCPFAKAVHVKGQVRMQVCAASEGTEVMEALQDELRFIAASDAQAHDTTLLVLPGAFDDFLEFNALVAQGERLVRRLGLSGVIQLASFHPRFQFAGTDEDDIGNFTNRSPYPTLHLLREESIDRAVQAFPDASAIYDTNIGTLQRLGLAGWDALDVGPKQ